MTVKELIEVLKQYPQDLPICYQLFSEQTIFEKHELKIRELCLPREDGWIQNKRPDKPFQQYLVLPGN